MAHEVEIGAGGVRLQGTLALPAHPQGLILFAQGSGSSRHSPRNRQVAAQLQEEGLGTLLFDLLTREEGRRDEVTAELLEAAWRCHEQSGPTLPQVEARPPSDQRERPKQKVAVPRFDIPLLASRMVDATRWAAARPELRHLALGYFGASTGAAAALVAAAGQPGIEAIVARGGRPDLAGAALASTHAATLLIVGGRDPAVIEMNETAFGQLSAPVKQLVIVPGATHLFEEPGTLDAVARLASGWFSGYLGTEGAAA